MTVAHFLAGLACGAAGVVVAAALPHPRRALLFYALAAGVCAGILAWCLVRGIPDAEVLGWTASLSMAALLARRAMPWAIAAVLAGLLVALWMGALAIYGVPIWLAAPVALAPPLFAHRRSMRPDFAHPDLVDEALLVVSVLAAISALVPGVTNGWQAAGALTTASGEAPDTTLPTWVMAVSVIPLLLGMTRALWSHR